MPFVILLELPKECECLFVVGKRIVVEVDVEKCVGEQSHRHGDSYVFVAIQLTIERVPVRKSSFKHRTYPNPSKVSASSTVSPM